MRGQSATIAPRSLLRIGLIACLVCALATGFSRPVHAQSTQYGIDVSSWQGSIGWPSVAASGVSFAYIRAVVGTSTDIDFTQNWDGALNAGVAPGAYLYFKPGSDPATQANLLIQQLQTVTFGAGSLVPAIDIEETDGLGPAAIVSNLHVVVNTVVSRLGVLPAIYTAPSWWDGNVQSSDFTADPLWVANWCGSCGSPSTPANNWGGYGWQAWQYTSNGSVPGIAGNVDQDVGNPGPPLYPGATISTINAPQAIPPNASVSITGTVTPPYSSGSFTFTVNGAPISGCSQLAVRGGQATCRTSALQPGTHRVAALYSTGAGYFSSAAAMNIAVDNTPWTTATGSPVTVTDAGQQLVFWRGTDSHLHETWGTPTGWGAADLTAALGGSQLAAPPAVVISGTQQLVFWQGTDNHLWEAWYTHGVGWAGPVDYTSRLGGGALASAPSVVITPTGQQLVFWRDGAGHLIEAWFTPAYGWAGPRDYSAQLGGGGLLASAPSVALTDGGQQLVFWQGTNSHLWEAWFTPAYGWAGPVDYTAALGGAGLLNSTPRVALTPGGQQLVFWQGTDSHLWEAWYTPAYGWAGPVDYSAQLGGAGPLASTPAVGLTSGGQQLVFWQGTNSHLWEAWFTPNYGWAGPMDWTMVQGQGNGPVSAAPSLEVTPGQQQLLFWQGTSGHVWEALFAYAWSGPYDWTAA